MKILPIVSLFIFWSIYSYFFKMITSPYHLFLRITGDWKVLTPHIYATFFEMLIGIILAILIAFVFSYLMFRFKLLKLFLEPYFIIMQCLPMVVLAPLLVMVFGWSFTAVIIPTALMIAFPLTTSLYKGFTMTPQNYLDFFKLHGACEKKVFWYLRLPFALPHFFSGLRISAATAGIGALGGEWAGAQRGVGVLMQIYRRQFDIEGVFLCIIFLLFLTLSFYILSRFIEKIIFRGNHEYIKEMDRSSHASTAYL